MLAQFWNTTSAEQSARHPADEHAPAGAAHVVRAVDVDAEPSVVFRWLCQLKIAPYSYDLVDNLGRRSPRALTPGADDLAVGQRFMVGRIAGFAPDDFIVVETFPLARTVFGSYAISYQVTAGRRTRSRIVACLSVDATGSIGQARARLMAVGDLVMMRKQLLNLREFAEDQQRRSAHV